MNQSFWNKNKVLILGFLSAISIAITPFIQNGNPGNVVKWSTVGFAVLIAGLSYLGNVWRGQGLTIFGFLGNAMFVAASLLVQGSHVNPQYFIMQLILQTFTAVITTVGPDPKSRGYENTPMIKEAKKQGEDIQPAKWTVKPK